MRPNHYPNDDGARPPFGQCCDCLRQTWLPNIVILPRRSPTPGTGWGCAICNPPFDGAVALLCEDCIPAVPRFVCEGSPLHAGRVPYRDLGDEKFGHDFAKHGAGSDPL